MDKNNSTKNRMGIWKYTVVRDLHYMLSGILFEGRLIS